MSHIDDGTLHAYLDGQVAEPRLTEIEKHFAACDHCQARLQEAESLGRRASDLLAELQPTAAAPPPWSEIVQRASARAEPPRPRLRPSLAWAASIALAFAVGWAARAYWLTPALPTSSREIIAPATVPERQATRRQGADAAEEVAPPAAPAFRDRDEPETAAESRVAKTEPSAAEPAVAGRVDALGQANAEAERDRLRDAADREPDVADAVEPRAGAVAGAERRAAELAEDVALVPLTIEGGERRTVVPPQQTRAARAGVAAREGAAFVAVPTPDAEVWLGAELRTLPDLELKHVEVGPGGTVRGGLAGLPAVRLVYSDAAGHEIVLTQQAPGGRDVETEEPNRTLFVEPSGARSYRWFDDDGYLLILQGNISSDSLRALADRVR